MLAKRISLRLLICFAFLLVTLGSRELFLLFQRNQTLAARPSKGAHKPAHTQNQRAGVTDFLDRLPHKILTHPAKLCQRDLAAGTSPEPSVAIGMASRASDSALREFTRRMLNDMLGLSVPLFFVMMMDEDKFSKAAPWEEIKRYQDLLIYAQPEMYQALSNSTQVTMAYFYDQCDAEYLLKMDQDVALNWNTFVAGLKDINRHRSQLKNVIYAGHPMYRSPIIRDVNHRNYESSDVFAKAKYFPPYNSGFAYVMSRSAVAQSLEVLLTVFEGVDFRNEDAMVGTALSTQGVTASKFRGFYHVWSSTEIARECGNRTLTTHTAPAILQCECDQWVAYHCGSGHRELCVNAWKVVSDCHNRRWLFPLLSRELDKGSGDERKRRV
eukprot:Blabericola_migrator_1__716@NODE_1178_length_5203_cov_57_765576_g801_i0_p2_GENE_NODE_1178_length_5203_cov_57_765576_g801_i0NODE_1178_length_5203_cov_57_765576_g801_i0_p2_ORF_typecomplete_len383_score40_77Galactosyl_T/PF01762_21/1_3e24Fringe/PF02434_16/5_1e06_NODE_1178_length_5203_cov_57_765576_g801_i019723120